MSTSVSGLSSNFFPSAENGFTTTTSGSVSSGAATVGLNSVAGYSNGEVAVFVIDPTDASKKQTFTGVIDTSGVQVTSVVWTAGTNQTHALGATVVDYETATHWSMVTKGLLTAGLNQDGTITPKTKTSINDVNGNELIKVTATGSAVNELTVTNAATGNAPSISATGGDSAINLNLRGKGLAKTVTIGAGATPVFAYDYVMSGCVLSGDAYASTLNYSMTSGVVVINGNPVTVASFSATAATASRDTYVDILDNGDGTGLVVNTGGNVVTNNNASPALAANSIRVGIVVSGAGNIAAATSINQGQETRVLPIASSIPYTFTDSLGNIICPRDPQRRVLGYRQIVSNAASSGTGNTATFMQTPVIIPTGRKYKVTVYASAFSNSGANQSILRIFSGAGVGGTQLQQFRMDPYAGTASVPGTMTFQDQSLTGSQTFTVGIQTGTGTATITAAATAPAFIQVELV